MRKELQQLRQYNKFLLKHLTDKGYHNGMVGIRLNQLLKRKWRDNLYIYKESLKHEADKMRHDLKIDVSTL